MKMGRVYSQQLIARILAGFFVVFLLRNVGISTSIKLLYNIREDKEEGKV